MIQKYPSYNMTKRVTREQRATREKRVILNAHETSPLGIVIIVKYGYILQIEF